MGDEREDMMIEAGKHRPTRSPAVQQHYVALMHPLAGQDMRENSLISTTWATATRTGSTTTSSAHGAAAASSRRT